MTPPRIQPEPLGDQSGGQLEEGLHAARRRAQLASPHTLEGTQRRERVAELERGLSSRALRGPAAAEQVAAVRGPKGARIGDVVIADRSRWEVLAIDQPRREAICRLVAGSRVLHRFRARAIERVERAPRRRAGHGGQLVLDVGDPERG